MNIENIHSLVETLKCVGLDGTIGRELLRYICFVPSEFTLTKQIIRDKDLVFCSFSFVRKKEEYTCSYYEVSLLKNIGIPDRVIESVNLRDLDKKMAAIEWVDQDTASDFNLLDEAKWKREREIEQVVKDLLKLSSCEEGKYFADALKVKHWSSCMNNILFGNLNSLRSKFEISQRFYFMEGHVISIEEAYRFLLNKWMEKQQHLNRMQFADSGRDESFDETSDMVKERTLLPKKRKARKGKLKS